MRSLILLMLALLSACDTTIPITQITLRVHSIGAITGKSDSTLHLERRALRKGKWTTPTNVERKFTQIDKWPVDVPVTASDSVDESEQIELIVRAQDSSGEAFAEARVITSFVRRKAKLLEVVLLPCGDTGVCENKEDCRGGDCDTCQFVCDGCNEVKCRDTPSTPGSELDDYLPDAGIVAISTVIAEPDASEADEDGGEEDGGPGVDSADAADAGEADAVTLDPTEGGNDGSMDAEAMSPDAGDADAAEPSTACDAGEAVCVGAGEKDVQRCVGGKAVVDYCEHTCLRGRCVDCKPEAGGRCDPQNGYVPQLCNADGYWTSNLTEAPLGECAGLCEAGKCKGECRGQSYRCSTSSDNMRQECVANLWVDERKCRGFCEAGECDMPLSCVADPVCASNASCCNSLSVVGGTFKRSYDRVSFTDDSFGARVATFRLDRFEVTVERFRRWVSLFPASLPEIGKGKNSNNPLDQGWKRQWSEVLGTDRDKLISDLSCDKSNQTWLVGSDANDDKPINCVNWYMAQAFCIWDGGRLPTEAEWNYASAGGDEQRVYPFSMPPSLAEIDAGQAIFGSQPIADVGSRPSGNGRWGHSDLAGNVTEWVQDEYADPYSYANCDNCADHTDGTCKVYRGGGSGLPEDLATASYRDCLPPLLRHGKVGFRCARLQ